MNELAQQIARNLLCDDPEIEARIEHGIEENRKGSIALCLKDEHGNPVRKATVRFKMQRHHFHFGCNAFMLGQFPQEEQNAAYAHIFAETFNLAVVPFYWSDLEPEDGAPRFEKKSRPIYRRPPPDMVLDFCRENAITPKGHPLLWQCFYPQWLHLGGKELEHRIERRFREIAERYHGSIRYWDVANEAQSCDPQQRGLPDRHVEFAFRLAQQYFPGSTLLYNDDNKWWDYHGVYSQVFLLAQRLQDRGLNLGGLGLQFHMFFQNQIANLRNYANNALNARHLFTCLDLYHRLGVPVNMSEISIPALHQLGDGDLFQKLVTERLFRLWFSHPAMNGIIWWNLVDGTAAYAPMGTEEGENAFRAGLLNYDFTPKPAFTAIRKLIHEDWTTQGTLEYAEGAPNRLRGFYGEYEARITTDAGTFTRTINLSPNGVGEQVLALQREECER